MTRQPWVRPAPFPYRRNSLNLFRLILAATVLFAHAWYIIGQGTGPSIRGENLGGWAVAGFFVLSGFLITRSRLRTSAGEYLVHRIARIYPAFIVVLLATACVFAPIALLIQQGSLAGFFTGAPTPAQYVWGNLGLNITQYDIGATLQGVPYPGAWNGSLWTLYYEFLCYLIVWVLGFSALFRRSPVVVAVAFAVSVGVYAFLGALEPFGFDERFALLARLLPFFLGGALLHYLIEKWGVSRLAGLLALVVAAVVIFLVPRWGGQLAAPLLGYGLLSLSTWIPQPRWVEENDVSYGFYIYAWPVQQLTVLILGPDIPMAAYLAVTCLATFLAAWASWVLVERPIMSRVRASRAADGRSQAKVAESAP